MRSIMGTTTMRLALAALSSSVAQAGVVRLNNAYYEDTMDTKSGCDSITSSRCTLSSTITPSDAYLSVKHVSCNATTGSLILFVYFQVWTAPPGTSNALLVRSTMLGFPNPTALPNGTYKYAWDTDTFYVAGKGKYVVLSAQTWDAKGAFLTCGIMGEMIPGE